MRDASRTDRPGEPAGARAPARQRAPRRPAAAAPPRPDRDAGQAPLPPGHDGPRESTRHRDTRIGGAVVAVASAGVAWGAWRAGPRTLGRSRRSRWRGGGRFEPRSTSRAERGASPPRAGPPGARAPRRESWRTLRRSRQHRVRHLSGLRGRGRPRPHPAHQRPRAVRDREVGFGQGRAVGADREGPLVLGGDRLEAPCDSVGRLGWNVDGHHRARVRRPGTRAPRLSAGERRGGETAREQAYDCSVPHSHTQDCTSESAASPPDRLHAHRAGPPFGSLTLAGPGGRGERRPSRRRGSRAPYSVYPARTRLERARRAHVLELGAGNRVPSHMGPGARAVRAVAARLSAATARSSGPGAPRGGPARRRRGPAAPPPPPPRPARIRPPPHRPPPAYRAVTRRPPPMDPPRPRR